MKMDVAVQSSVVEWLQPGEATEWDDFVNEHPHGLVYHRTAWRQTLEQAFAHIRGRFLVLRNRSTGAIEAGLPVYTVKSWLLGNRAVSVPFASFCDPLVSSANDFEQLLFGIRDDFWATSFRQLQMRMRPAAQLLLKTPITPGFKQHFLPLRKDTESLFGTFSKTAIRQPATKATKAGVIIIEPQNSHATAICHDILTQTRRRLGLPPMPISFFAAMQFHLVPEHMKVFLALHNGRPVGCHIVFTSRDLWTSEYLGSTDDTVPGANQLLYWEAIKAARSAGARVFSFGRTSETNEGLLAHKRRWGTIEEDLAYSSIPLGSPTIENTPPGTNTDSAYRAVRFVAGISPMFIFRKIGDFCYRHLG
jgi:serine/alanine adding enzyme